MNSVQRRLFRAFVESGGDLTHEALVDRLIQHVNASVWVMPPKVKRALELALHAEEQLHYADLAGRLSGEEGAVSEPIRRIWARRVNVSGRSCLWAVVEEPPWRLMPACSRWMTSPGCPDRRSGSQPVARPRTSRMRAATPAPRTFVSIA